jgi:hypothetical protein
LENGRSTFAWSVAALIGRRADISFGWVRVTELFPTATEEDPNCNGCGTPAPQDGNGRPQVAALDISRLEVQQAIQLAVKAAPMRCDRAVGEIGPPVPDRAGILQERPELRCEACPYRLPTAR